MSKKKKKTEKRFFQPERMDFRQIVKKSNSQLSEGNIEQMINSPEFVSFALSIEHQINDGITFNEILSSPIILTAATKIIEKFSVKEKEKEETVSHDY
ncbi:MAG: hypothetical protein GF308_11860 [Candidatus Heimdallarchaeota archaeon]|nr:hypothetical protein [Candidatus Heimdallarchaeota archaeon]